MIQCARCHGHRLSDITAIDEEDARFLCSDCGWAGMVALFRLALSMHQVEGPYPPSPMDDLEQIPTWMRRASA